MSTHGLDLKWLKLFISEHTMTYKNEQNPPQSVWSSFWSWIRPLGPLQCYWNKINLLLYSWSISLGSSIKKKFKALLFIHFIYFLSDYAAQVKLPCYTVQVNTGVTPDCSQRFPNIIQEWQQECSISPMSPRCTSESYNNRTSASSCRVSGSPAVLLCLAFGEVVTDIHCVTGL